jgi:sugar lactone lactonase YvrE
MRARAGWTAGAAALAFAVALIGAPASQASSLPSCPGAPQPQVLYKGFGVLESVISDSQGRLYFTDTANNRIMRSDGPGVPPQQFATGIESGGGMVFDPATGDLLVGYGDGLANGVAGTLNPQAGVVRVNTGTGAVTPYATGTQMSNGIARGPDGSLYASNDLGFGIDRIDPGTHGVTLNWASLFSSNGLVVDPTGRYLYSAQTFQPPAIARIDLADPSHVETVFSGPLDAISAGLDGMTRDDAGNLYVAANFRQEIWKVDPATGGACALARGLSNPSSVAFGGGTAGFIKQNLYAVTFGGEVVELPNVGAADVPPPASGKPGNAHRKAKAKRCRRRKPRGKGRRPRR